MTKTKLYGIIATTVVVSALLGVTMISESESVQPKDVVTMHCTGDFPGGYKIFSTSSSANAPTITTGPGTNCAQALADLLDASFQMQIVETADGGVVYILIR